MSLKKTLLLGILLLASVVYLKKVSLPAAKHKEESQKVFSTSDATDFESLRINRRSNSSGEAEESFVLKSGIGKGIMPSADVASVTSPTSSDTDSDDQPSQSNTKVLKEWGIEGVPGAVVDVSGLSGLITGLRSLKTGEEIEKSDLETDFSVYGLSKPPLTVVATLKSGNVVELAFGKKNDYLGQRYLKVSGRSGVYLVDESTFTTLNKGKNDLRDKTPIKFEDPDVRTVEFVVKGESTLLTQKTAGEWEVKGEGVYKASSSAVGDLLRGLKDLRIADIADGGTLSASNGLDVPFQKISLTFRDGVSPKQLEVKVGKIKERSGKEGEENVTTYFTYSGSPSVFTTLASSLDSLPSHFDGFRDKTIFPITSSEVAKVTVSGNDYQTVDLSSDGVDWKVNGKAADPVFAEEVVENILNLKVDAYAYQNSSTEIGIPERKIEVLKKSTASNKTVLLLGKRINDGATDFWIGQIEGQKETFRIKDEAVRKASPREETLLAATPTPSASPASVSSAVATPGKT